MIPRSPTTKRSNNDVSSKRTPIPLRATPVPSATTSIPTSSTTTRSKSTPHEVMVASQLAHINELVQKKRFLENAVKKLTDDLNKSTSECSSLLQERATWEHDRNAWKKDQNKWMDERKAWMEGLDTIQACHRIQQYRMACALSDERIAVHNMQEKARKARLMSLQRDFKISQFQAHETELEGQIAELEEFRDSAEGERIQAEEELRRLREAHSDASAAALSSSSKFTRLTAQCNTLQGQVDTLQEALKSAQEESNQLREQLKSLQDRRKSEDADLNSWKKQKADLDTELDTMKKRVNEMEAQAAEFQAMEAGFQKQKGRLEKLKGVLEEWKAEAKEQELAREAAEAQVAVANAQTVALEQEISDLRARLDSVPKPKHKGKKLSPARFVTNEEPESDTPIETMGPSTSVPTKKPKSKKPTLVPDKTDADLQILEATRPQDQAPEPTMKAVGKRKATDVDADKDSDPPRGEDQKKRTKRTKKVKQIDTTKERDMDEDRRTRRVERKKVSRSSWSDECDEGPSSKSNLRKASSQPTSKLKSKKATSPEPVSKSKKSKPRRPQADGDDSDADPAPKRKKRKINLFPSSQPVTFDWDSLTQGSKGLGIPTQLSPMKETSIVPRRLGRVSRDQ